MHLDFELADFGCLPSIHKDGIKCRASVFVMQSIPGERSSCLGLMKKVVTYQDQVALGIKFMLGQDAPVVIQEQVQLILLPLDAYRQRLGLFLGMNSVDMR